MDQLAFGLNSAQGIVLLLLGIAVFGMAVWALIRAVRFSPEAYVAAGKRTKTFWVVITAVATGLGFIAVGGAGVIGLPGILAAGGAIYFLTGVSPAVEAASGRGRSNGGYGSW